MRGNIASTLKNMIWKPLQLNSLPVEKNIDTWTPHGTAQNNWVRESNP